MIKIIIPIISLDSLLMIKHSGSGTPNDDQKQVKLIPRLSDVYVVCGTELDGAAALL